MAAGEAVHKTMGTPLSSEEQAIVTSYLEVVEKRISGEVRKGIRAEGSAMTMDEAIEYALAE